MKSFFLFFIFIVATKILSGQESRRDNIWMLGINNDTTIPKSAINFNSGTADTFSFIRSMSIFITNASICDTNGQLLFYTNGNYVSNRLHQMMPGTAGFNPGDHTTSTYPYGNGIVQGAMIIPWPKRPDEYILLHMSGDNFWIGGHFYTRPLSLRYSLIDMRMDSGYGDFSTIKNEILVDDTIVTGRIAACRHGNGRDWWILSHEAWSNQFYKFLLSPDTILMYGSQNIGPVIIPEDDVLGSAVFTNSCDRLAYLTDSIMTIYDFNRCTGELDNPIMAYFPDTLSLSMLNCAFSESGRYLYACNNFHIFQFDMLAADIPASKTIVATYDGYITPQFFRSIFNLMKLAPDHKIYVSTYEGSSYFHVINSPDSAGLACNVTQHSFVLPSYNAFSMPNTPNYTLGALDGSVCDSLRNSIPIPESAGNFFSIYPNPANDVINIQLNGNINFSQANLIIYNSLGKIVHHSIIKDENELHKINLHNLASGIYICSVIINGEVNYMGKLSIIRKN